MRQSTAQFTINSHLPATSLTVRFETEDEVNDLFNKLADGGKVLMPLDKYPFNSRFGWVSDEFGVSWQVCLASK